MFHRHEVDDGIWMEVMQDRATVVTRILVITLLFRDTAAKGHRGGVVW
jgi:hypothetical protein